MYCQLGLIPQALQSTLQLDFGRFFVLSFVVKYFRGFFLFTVTAGIKIEGYRY